MHKRYQQALYALAFFFAALSLAPALAHLFALPNKIGLPRDQYFVVPMIYNGWALLASSFSARSCRCLPSPLPYAMNAARCSG